MKIMSVNNNTLQLSKNKVESNNTSNLSTLNRLAFQGGQLCVTSDGFKPMLRRMPEKFRNQIKQFRRFVKKDLPDGTTVMLNCHNQRVVNPNRNCLHHDFTKTAKGAQVPNDVILNVHVVGDPSKTHFGISGDELDYWIPKLEQHCRENTQ